MLIQSSCPGQAETPNTNTYDNKLSRHSFSPNNKLYIFQYDVRMTHLLGNNKSEVDEQEIFIDESFLPTTAPTIDIDDDDGEDVHKEPQEVTIS